MKIETIKEAVQLRKAHLNLAKHALNKNCSVTVHYGDGEDELTKSKDFAAIKDAVEACDESYMIIHNHEDKKIGWAWIVFGNDDDELVSDYSVSDFMENWWNQFQEMYEATN